MKTKTILTQILILIYFNVVNCSVNLRRIGLINKNEGDASSILQAAFQEAGITLDANNEGHQISSPPFAPPTPSSSYSLSKLNKFNSKLHNKISNKLASSNKFKHAFFPLKKKSAIHLPHIKLRLPFKPKKFNKFSQNKIPFLISNYNPFKPKPLKFDINSDGLTNILPSVPTGYTLPVMLPNINTNMNYYPENFNSMSNMKNTHNPSNSYSTERKPTSKSYQNNNSYSMNKYKDGPIPPMNVETRKVNDEYLSLNNKNNYRKNKNTKKYNPTSYKMSKEINKSGPLYEYGGFKPITPHEHEASESYHQYVYSSRNNGQLNNHRETYGDIDYSRATMRKDDKLYETSEEDEYESYEEEKVLDMKNILEELKKRNLTQKVNTTSSCENKNLGWCDLTTENDQNYPLEFVTDIIEKCSEVFNRMYVEVPENIVNYQLEKEVTVKNSTKSKRNQNRKKGNKGATTPAPKENKVYCDSDKKLIRPSIAKDIHGRWYLVVQTNMYHQRVPVQICKKISVSCNSSKCANEGKCIQKFNTQLLISIDLEKNEDICPIMKLYRFPSGCNCN